SLQTSEEYFFIFFRFLHVFLCIFGSKGGVRGPQAPLFSRLIRFSAIGFSGFAAEILEPDPRERRGLFKLVRSTSSYFFWFLHVFLCIFGSKGGVRGPQAPLFSQLIRFSAIGFSGFAAEILEPDPRERRGLFKLVRSTSSYFFGFCMFSFAFLGQRSGCGGRRPRFFPDLFVFQQLDLAGLLLKSLSQTLGNEEVFSN